MAHVSTSDTGNAFSSVKLHPTTNSSNQKSVRLAVGLSLSLFALAAGGCKGRYALGGYDPHPIYGKPGNSQRHDHRDVRVATSHSRHGHDQNGRDHRPNERDYQKEKYRGPSPDYRHRGRDERSEDNQWNQMPDPNPRWNNKHPEHRR